MFAQKKTRPKTRDNKMVFDQHMLQQPIIAHLMPSIEAHPVETRLLILLQQSLDIQTILQFFFYTISSEFGLQSGKYENNGLNINWSTGIPATHSAQYRLSHEHTYLGEIILTRKNKLTHAEIARIELLISLLVCPIKNSLLYHGALKKSLTDPLTQAGNRIALEHSLRHTIDVSKRYNSPLSVLLIDIDRFKQVNDTYGHQAGDFIIQETANALGGTSRTADRLFRYGGEEFVIILHKTDLKGAFVIAERLRAKIAGEAFVYKKQDIPITVSIGCSSFSTNDSQESILQRADAALYEAKNEGRNRVKIKADPATTPHFS